MMTAPDMLEAPATVAHRSREGPPHNRDAPYEPPGSGAFTGTATPRSVASLGSFVLQDPGPPKTPPSTAPPTSMSSLRAPSEPPSHSSNPLPDCMRVQARLAGVQPLPDPLHAVLPAGGKGRREASTTTPDSPTRACSRSRQRRPWAARQPQGSRDGAQVGMMSWNCSPSSASALHAPTPSPL